MLKVKIVFTDGTQLVEEFTSRFLLDVFLDELVSKQWVRNNNSDGSSIYNTRKIKYVKTI